MEETLKSDIVMDEEACGLGDDMITSIYVRGLSYSIIASGFPMQTEMMSAEDFERVCDGVFDNCLEESYQGRDIQRAIKLARSEMGSGHDNFLNGIRVDFNLVISNKMWVELLRYHFVDVVSSMSTMHRLKSMDLDDDNLFDEHVDRRVVYILQELQEEYEKEPTPENFLKLVMTCPAGIRIGARVTMNYRQLKTIWHQRKDHRLPEWRFFCKWIETLPLMSEILHTGMLN